MTTHDDLHDLETRLRASLRDRAADVETTPALYERVERQASRGALVRRGFALAGAVAAIGVAVAVVPSLLPDPTPFDVVDTPEESLPSDTPTAAEDSEPAVPVDGAQGADEFATRRLALAERLEDGRTRIVGDERTVFTEQDVVTLAASASGRWLVAGLADGSIGVIDLGEVGDGFDEIIEAEANGGAVVPTPLGDGVAWIQGTDLFVRPLVDGRVVRVLSLEGEVPDDLRIEQWSARADAQVILASAPGGGLWSIPMEGSDIRNTVPTDPAFVLADDAVDGAILDDLTRIELALDQAGTGLVLRRDGEPATEVGLSLPAGSDVALTTDGGRIAVHHRETGTGELYEEFGGGLAVGAPPSFSWDAETIRAITPLVVVGRQGEDSTTDGAAGLGLRTDAPLVGTDGIDLVIRDADGTEDRRTVYRPAGESEAVLGDLAVRPGSTATDGLVAIESFSEGETSIRFAGLDGDSAGPVGSIIVTAGEVDALVWSEDGTHVAWTDPDGLWAVEIEGDGQQVSPPQFLAEDPRPVVDWVWTDGGDGPTLGGWFALRNGRTGTEFLGVERAADGQLSLTTPVGGADRVVFDTHASPGAAVGPDVNAQVLDSGVNLFWGADGDRFGELASPGDVGGDVRVEVGGGQVVVMGSQRQVLVTFDGDVVELPQLTDWDVLD